MKSRHNKLIFMKKINLLCAMLLCTSIVFAQQTKRVHPDRATHYIKGNFSASMQDGKPIYKLQNVSTEGISFHQAENYYGEVTDLGDLRFTFDSARTTYPGGFYENDLAFWFYDKEIGEWQPDIEIRQATGSFDNQKIMTIMLVLDCSSSLGKDFSKVKAGAKFFLDKLYSVSNTGNVRIGIIGFSSLKNTNKSILSISKLNPENYPQMLDFIDQLTMDNGTALYYAIDKSVYLMDSYANSMVGEDLDNYARSCIVTFTDGIDQTSQDLTNGILNADAYYEKVKNEVITRPIKDKKIDSYVISVKGIDITSEGMIHKFDRVLSNIVTTESNYMKIEQISELRAKFGEIADNLINSWQILNCYVPAARQGLVCWTMGEEKKVPKEKPVKEKTMLLGLNIGGASPLYFAYDGIYRKGFDMTLGLDFAYPITQNFALGFYVQSGLGFRLESEWSILRDAYHSCYYDQYNWEMNTGLLMTMGDMRQKNAFLLGLGAGILGNWYAAWSFNMRLGFVNHTGVYMSFDLNTDFGAGYKSGYDIDGNYYWNTISYFRPAISIGYNFGALYDVK